MVKEGNESYLWIPGLGRDVEDFAWKPTAWVEAAEGYPLSPAKKNHRDEAPKDLPGLLTEHKEHPEWHPLKGNYIIPLTKKKISQFTVCEKSISHISGY